jgi:hypothetical protein
MTTEIAKCELCGEPMPEGEEMFKFHGYSGPCPKPPLPTVPKPDHVTDEMVGAAHKALMSQLFVLCQPKWGDVFAFMDDHPELLRIALEAARATGEGK